MMELMRSGTGRIAKRDVAIAVLVSALGVALMVINTADPPPRPADERAAVHIGNLLPYEAIIPLFLLVTAPLLWRRAAPLAAVTAAIGGLLLNDLLVGTEVIRCGVLIPTAFLFAFATGAELDRDKALLGLGLTLVFLIADLALEFGTEPFSLVFIAIVVAMWGIGRIVHSSRALSLEMGV